MITDAYGEVPEDLYTLLQDRNVSPADYDTLVDHLGTDPDRITEFVRMHTSGGAYVEPVAFPTRADEQLAYSRRELATGLQTFAPRKITYPRTTEVTFEVVDAPAKRPGMAYDTELAIVARARPAGSDEPGVVVGDFLGLSKDAARSLRDALDLYLDAAPWTPTPGLAL